MLPNDLIGRFTTHLKETLQTALTFAVSNGREAVEPGDVLVGLLHEKGSLGGEILKKAGCKPSAAEDRFRGSPSKKNTVAALDLSEPVKKILERCVVLAHLREHRFVGTEHLLSALLDANDPLLSKFFSDQKIDPSDLKMQTEAVLRSASQFPSMDQMERRAQESSDEPESLSDRSLLSPHPLPSANAGMENSVLEQFARELTIPETAIELDPVIGRDTEISRIIEILIRRSKSNPILLGDPGVGKTAIVEGLATRIASGDVPDALHGHRLLCLDLASTVAGTMYRGEFEARLKQIVEEARKDPHTILFIDELHNIVGAGSTSGSLDAANILKPALARGEIRCIGATTWNEYKKHIETDAALERRFQPVSIQEPDEATTLEMLKGLSERYAKHHHVTYTPEALQAAVDLSGRFFTDRFFPDKAVDLLDEAAASVIAKRQSQDIRERLAVLDAAIRSKLELSENLLAQQSLFEAQQEAASAETLTKERDQLLNRLNRTRTRHRPRITATHVAQVVSRTAGIPLSMVLANERQRLQGFGARMQARFFGQSVAIDQIAQSVRRAQLGLQIKRRPKAALLFAGPSGTGKTESARFIAEDLFGRADAFIKLDMSEFSESHSISKLIGSPAGYVGYRDGARLTDAVRKRPHCVVCFDEFEKCHPAVQHTLLQVLEDGALSDATGRTVSFRHAYLILTSNVGSQNLQKKPLGFGDESGIMDPLIHEELKSRFSAELLNRLDRIVCFSPLSQDHLRQILEQELSDVCQRLEAAQQISCRINPSVYSWLLRQPYASEEGARAIRHLIEREIIAPISQYLITHHRTSRVSLSVNGKTLNIRS